MTDMEVKCDGKSVFKADTDTNEKIGTIWSHITEEETKTAPQTFNSSVKVASSKVTVKAKKKAQVKVTTLFKGDKVTVSSNKMSVATASYSAKTGKVTIVGKKAGKAVISVKTGGATKKISVTVKKKKKKK